ncbi:MAG: ABC transporter permease [Alphaproteobacteria bacterium]|nr:ABC transporter permease [Alphaproteobacteria bacterium]MBU2084454.1 ABC transporter permease [Alphaproteobacteria bacterium]MBU2142462.1 ABC transporter permease [Alphaproteobacteria bacterium]MBU2197785.1 ABC transporter permease [Alphaproteobacteria bacterium]
MADTVSPEFALDESGERTVLRLTGDWTVQHVQDVDDALRALNVSSPLAVDVSDLGKLDTAGAFVIDRTLRAAGSDEQGEPNIIGEHPNASRLIAQIHAVSTPAPASPALDGGLMAMLDRTGRTFMHIFAESISTLAFLGETLVTCARLIVQPWKLRWTSIVAVMEESGLDALPIITFLSFFVGMVIAFIGATTLKSFDLEIYTVELIGYSELREFGVVLTGIVLAGRTNSSFTAQIGTMKMRQEIDAMQTLGLKPMEVLVAPRVLAMLIITPVLAFAATLAGIAGGMMVAWLSLDINPGVFILRLRDSVPIDQFWVGMSKAPVFGLVCVLIACRQGLNVGGSVQSLGRATTTSVVQALFSIIAIDAMFAIFYMELGI